MKKRFLSFYHRGERYLVNEAGHIKANGLPGFSSTWLFLGGSRRLRRKGLDVSRSAAFESPDLLNGCLGWDLDHGTTRRWLGSFHGKLPRISGATVFESEIENPS